MTVVAHGIPRHSEAQGLVPATSREELDAAARALAGTRDTWAAVPPRERVAILDRLIEDFLAVSGLWVMASLEAKDVAAGTPGEADEWLAGPFSVLRNMRLLRESLAELAADRTPRVPGPVRPLPDGQVAARVFPATIWDRAFYAGVTADIWMQPGVGMAGVSGTQALAYRAGAIAAEGPGSPSPAGRRTDAGGSGAVCLVLGAGNVSSIGPMDTLYKLFVENRVVLYKAHPVNAYLGPLMERAFAAVIERGALKVVYGGAETGTYLCAHDAVDEIHITGSDKTYDAIVFGAGPDGERRKAAGTPALAKRVTAELGNVSPVIVVPGPWSERDIRYQAVNLVSSLVNNAGFNCNASRVIVQHAGWTLRPRLLDAVRAVLAGVPPRRAWYPGAASRDAAFRAAHPEAERFGPAGEGQLPWTLIPGLDPQRREDVCFGTEAFCGLWAETPIAAPDVPAYLERAVRFCNETLWGSLNATILVHPRSMADPAVRVAVERAIADLRYGAISVNHWGAIAYALGVTTWGAFPGHPATDIQSGTGVVHNTLMFSRAEKSVVRAPFRVWPLPPWFVSNRMGARLGPKLAAFEARPSLGKAMGIFGTAMRG